MKFEYNTKNAFATYRETPSRANQVKKVEKIVTITFSIEGMTCHFCARKIEEALSGLTGVKSVKADFGYREAIIEYNQEEVTSNELKAVVQTLGYKLIQKRVGNMEETKDRPKRWLGLKPYLFGVAAVIAVVGFYLGLLTLTSDWYNARLEFKHFGVWILALAAGLGVQVTLFSFYRAWHGESMKTAKYSLAASGGLSTTAMASCCSHYLAIILPVLGLPFLSAAG